MLLPWASGVSTALQWARKVGLSPWCIQRTEHQAKENNPWALKLNGIFPARFYTWLGPLTSSFRWLPFGLGKPILCLSLHYILEAYYISGFTESGLERNFCLRINHILSLIQTLFRWYLVEIWDLELMLGWVKTWAFGIGVNIFSL